MLDDLLGRSELKNRIEDLESERDRLQDRLEAEQARRREAVRDRQTSDERANRLEDRIAELEDRVARSEAEDAELDYRRVETLTGARTGEIIDRLAGISTADEGAVTAMVADEGPPDALREVFGERIALIGRAAPCLVVADDAAMLSAALVPPLPPDPFVEWGDGFTLEESWFRPVGSFTFALVRSDLFALGEYRGTHRNRFEGFESDVRADHSKGGFSQARFERRRDEQIDDHVDACSAAIAERNHERLIVVGERTLLGEFADEAVRTATVGATGSPKAALDEAFAEFWTTRLYCI